MVLRAAVTALVLALLVPPAVAGAEAGDPPAYRPPVDAPVDEPFRAPAHPYGPGHRGIEYRTPPGATVLAAAGGTVAFAGAVAGRRWVAIVHRDGLRTAYGPLGTIAVAAGQPVRAGEPLGTALDRLLFTVRRGRTYLDPATLLGGRRRPRLVPLAGGPEGLERRRPDHGR